MTCAVAGKSPGRNIKIAWQTESILSEHPARGLGSGMATQDRAWWRKGIPRTQPGEPSKLIALHP